MTSTTETKETKVPNHESTRTQRGQALVILALALVGLLGVVALIIDGGNAWSQQRQSQNAADSGSEAGSVILAEYWAGATAPSSSYTGPCPTATTDPWDLAVCEAVYGAGAQNGNTVVTANYTNYDGSLDLGLVGAGSLPAGAQGIRAVTTKQFSTFVAGIVGINQLGTGAQATSIVGAVTTFCPPNTICGTIPVAIPVQTSTCAGNASLQVGTDPWPVTTIFDDANESIVPLCRNGPGSVGWLDWPCNTTNGTPGLINEILTPCNSNLNLPQWIDTTTGNTNSPGVEDALNTYHDSLVWIPEFDATRGNGNNLQYHITQFQAFQLDWAYTNANNHPECNQDPGQPYVGGNGSTGCIKGWWTAATITGQVDINPLTQGQSGTLGVSLIK